eukprot:10523651-Ditylum_brightwellii.AAC.1
MVLDNGNNWKEAKLRQKTRKKHDKEKNKEKGREDETKRNAKKVNTGNETQFDSMKLDASSMTDNQPGWKTVKKSDAGNRHEHSG